MRKFLHLTTKENIRTCAHRQNFKPYKNWKMDLKFSIEVSNKEVI